MDTKNAPISKALRRVRKFRTRGTTQIAFHKNATSDSNKSFCTNAAYSEGTTAQKASRLRLRSEGPLDKLLYQLTPTADSLEIHLPDLLRHSL